MTNDKPTFKVKIEQGEKILVPQFQPSDLSDDQRAVYDGLREAAPRDQAGAIVVKEFAAPRFEGGETVTLSETTRRHVSDAREFFEALRSVRADLKATLPPVATDLAEAGQPLLEWRQDMVEDITENSDNER